VFTEMRRRVKRVVYTPQMLLSATTGATFGSKCKSAEPKTIPPREIPKDRPNLS
jgi:hypothetical protein